MDKKIQRLVAKETTAKKDREKCEKDTKKKTVLPKASRVTNIEPPEKLRTMMEDKSSLKEVAGQFALLEAKLQYPDKPCTEEEGESNNR